MKRVLSILICLILIGCANNQNVKKDLDSMLDSLNDVPANELHNNNRKYFDYYLPRHIGKRNKDELSGVFIANNVTFYMNLDIASVINNRYYSILNEKIYSNKFKELANIGEPFYYREGEMEDYDKVYQKYNVAIKELNNDYYLVYVDYNFTNFASVCRLSEINNLVYDIFEIARSIRIDEELVIATFSNKINIIIEDNYDLFNNKFPESGIVADIINKGQIDNENIDDVIDDENLEENVEDEENEDESEESEE